MKSREEITTEFKKPQFDWERTNLILEVLLDIREALQVLVIDESNKDLLTQHNSEV